MFFRIAHHDLPTKYEGNQCFSRATSSLSGRVRSTRRGLGKKQRDSGLKEPNGEGLLHWFDEIQFWKLLMFKVLKDLFDDLTRDISSGTSQDDEHVLQLATAALLVEVMRCDSDMKPAERDAAVASLRKNFLLSDEAMDDLFRQAEQESKSANDYFHFTSLLNDKLDHPQKIRVIENMWQVAYADKFIDANENHLISKVAGLLHVTHGEYIVAKMRAKEAALGPSAVSPFAAITGVQKLQPEG